MFGSIPQKPSWLVESEGLYSGFQSLKGLNPWHQTQGSMKELGIGNDSRGWQVFSTSWQQNNKLHCNTRFCRIGSIPQGSGWKLVTFKTPPYMFIFVGFWRKFLPIWIYILPNLRRQWRRGFPGCHWHEVSCHPGGDKGSSHRGASFEQWSKPTSDIPVWWLLKNGILINIRSLLSIIPI